jgi:hypothetical protein
LYRNAIGVGATQHLQGQVNDNVAENNLPGVNFGSARRSGRSETLSGKTSAACALKPNTENWERDANFSDSKGNFDRFFEGLGHGLPSASAGFGFIKGTSCSCFRRCHSDRNFEVNTLN